MVVVVPSEAPLGCVDNDRGARAHSVLVLSHHTVSAASSHLGWVLSLATAGTPAAGPTCWGTSPELPHPVAEHLPPTSALCGQLEQGIVRYNLPPLN